MKKIIYIFLSFVTSCALLEIGLRIFTIEKATFIEKLSHDDYIYKIGTVVNLGHNITTTITQDYLRDSHPSNLQGQKKFALIGDSYAMGLVDDSETISSYFNRLPANNNKIELLNAGIAGYQIEQYYYHTKRVLTRYPELDGVIICIFGGNDLTVPVRYPPTGFKKLLITKTRAYDFLNFKWTMFWMSFKTKVLRLPGEYQPSNKHLLAQTEENKERLWYNFRKTLPIVEFVKNKNKKIYMIYLPLAEMIDQTFLEHQIKVNKDKNIDTFYDLALLENKASNEFLRFCQKHNIECHSLVDAFKQSPIRKTNFKIEHERTTPILFNLLTGHPSKEGNELIAQNILALININQRAK